MKKAMTALSLLLILTAVSISPVHARTADDSQSLSFAEDPQFPAPPASPGGTTELLGDPDDAITGNRSHGFTDNEPPVLESLQGVPPAGGIDSDARILLIRLLDQLGLI